MTIALMLAAALGFADLDMLDRTVADYTGAPAGQVGGAITPVDRRLRLRQCSMPPMVSWLTPRRDAVLVQCPDAGSWRLSVPVYRSGAPVSAQVAEAPAVNRGDAVSISVEGDGFAVTQPGQVLEAGPVGAWVRVAPESRGGLASVQPLRAQVVRPGLVRIPAE
jgi:flagella basal body P-ring formation protein FlgA